MVAAGWARTGALLVALATLGTTVSGAPVRDTTEVHKATLKNGLHVVIVRNTIAPVVSTDLTYLVGSRDDPAGIPGMAHAQEHMMFRGTKNLSTAQLGTIATALGGAFNAQTTDTRTQYQFTVPASDLDAVLRIESDRMRDVLDLQSQWENERGAIEQEVARDEAQPGGDFFDDAQAIAFKGTVYEHPGVGTKAAFDKLTGPQIKAFYDRWYAPNNAVLVVAGDVDPAATLQAIRGYFDGIPAKAIPSRSPAQFAPLKRTVIRRPTTLAYPLAAVGFRLPGLDSPDFLASYVLQGILGANQAPLHALADDGKALDGEWVSEPYFPEAQLGFAIAALAPGSDPDAMARQLEAIMTNYQRHGVPSDLFETTKRRLISDQELSRNSIEQLASDWADTIALDGQPSIAHEQDLIAAVTLDDVNRVAKKYLDVDHAIVGALTPSFNASQNAPPQPTGVGKENPLGTQPVTALPAWATPLVGTPALPASRLTPTLTKLPNGITLVVQPETISDSVFVYGAVQTTPAIQEPLGKEGISSILEGMFAYGTQALDRNAFQRAQDDIDSSVSGGSSFGVQTTSANFDRAVALAAQNELTPRLDDDTLDVAKRRAIDELQTSLNSSHSVAVRRAAEKLLPAGDPELRQPTVAGMQAMSLNDLKAYDLKVMRPDLTTIVVVGNVTPEHAQAVIAKNFGDWHAAGPAPALDLPGVPRNPPAEVKVDLPNIRESFITLEQMVPITRTSADFYPLLLGNAILGGGSLGPEQSRLFRDIRQNAGLVYSIDSHIDAATVPRSRFAIEFACAPYNQARIEGLIAQEVARMRSEPVGAAELALMKASMVRRVVIGGGSVESIGGTLLDAAAHAQPLDQSQIDARKLISTDAPAIQAAFNAEILPGNFVRMLEGP
jgi:zinc protease